MASSRLAAYLAHCPVPLDPHHKARIKPITMKEYKRQTARFVNWLDGRGYAWDEFWELDLFIVFYKQSNLAAVSKGDFQTLVAAIEFAMPPVKGHLAWTHAALEGWGVAEGVRHTIPLPDPLMLVIAATWWTAGRPRIGMGIAIQKRTGLRPSELLALRARDILLPEDIPGHHYRSGLLSLGTRTGTKSKRVQSTVLPEGSLELEMARRLRQGLQPDDLVFGGFGYSQMASLLKVTCELHHLLPFRPHSPRAGFATDAHLAGWEFSRIRESLRQQNDKSLRIYLDAVAAYAALTSSDAAKWGSYARLLEPAFWEMLATGVFTLPPGPAADRIRTVASYLQSRRS